MIPMSDEIKLFYRDKQKLETRKFVYTTDFEDLLRSNRIISTKEEQNELYVKHGAYDLSQINLKKTIEVYKQDLTSDEVKKWKDFEKLLALVDNFDVLLEDDDLKKVLNLKLKPGEITYKQMCDSNYEIL